MSGAVALRSDLSCYSKPQKECLRQQNSRSICRTSMYELLLQVELVSIRTIKLFIKKRLGWMFGAIAFQLYLISRSNTENRSLLQQSSHSKCTMSIQNQQFSSYECISTHKCRLGKLLRCMFRSITQGSYFSQRYHRQQSSLSIGRAFLYDLQFCSRACKHAQDGIRERDRDACLHP